MPAFFSDSEPIHTFTAELRDAGGGGVYCCTPFNVEETFGTKGQVRIKCTIDGEPYRGSLANMGGGLGHIMPVLKAIRQKIGKAVGDSVHVELQRDLEERVVEVPQDLQDALTQTPQAQAIFEKLAYTHRREYVQWINEAKRAETRQNRISKAVELLAEGKKAK